MVYSKILVTGGAGFIGSHLVDRLIEERFEVAVLDNFRSGRVENIARQLESEKFKLIKGDVRDRRIVKEALDDVDAVVHLAALISVEESIKSPFETYDVNLTGTMNILEEAVRKGVKKFVYASSTAVYGEGNPLPLKEDHPLKSISPYAASKASAEFFCKAFNRSYGLNTIILRYFNVYGPRQEGNPYSGVIAKFVKNCSNNEPMTIYGDGNQTRDFVYVDDVVEATMLAIESSDAVGDVFNVCTGRPIKINELAQNVKDVLRKGELRVIYDKPRVGDIRDNYGDPTKAEDILGFKFRVKLDEGIKKLIEG
jgi:dTDP-glucose 4,6-dehydratase